MTARLTFSPDTEYPRHMLDGWDREFDWDGDLKQATVDGIIEFGNNTDRVRLASHPSVGAEGLRRLHKLEIPEVSEAVAVSPYLNGRGLTALIQSEPNPQVRLLFIANPAVDDQSIRALKRDRNRDVREAVALRLAGGPGSVELVPVVAGAERRSLFARKPRPSRSKRHGRRAAGEPGIVVPQLDVPDEFATELPAQQEPPAPELEFTPVEFTMPVSVDPGMVPLTPATFQEPAPLTRREARELERVQGTLDSNHRQRTTDSKLEQRRSFLAGRRA